MLIIEISKPRMLCQIKPICRDVLISLLFIPFVWGDFSTNGIMSGIIWCSIILGVLFVKILLFSHYCEYPYKVTFFQDYFIVEYLLLRIKFKRKYRYKNIEIMTRIHKNELYTRICHKILLGYNLFLSEPDGWSQEKQDVFIDAMKSKGVVVTRL